MASDFVYQGKAWIELNNNVPLFTKKDYSTKSFETYGELDSLGRCTTAYANVGQDLMPTKERESISQVKPTGWQKLEYDGIDGKFLYNRCHLIGYQLTAENANEKNLITGTRYLNVTGMLPFENMVADYVKETKGHVLYRVTPVFYQDELVARGVKMEGWSVEDNGESVCFNVFVYNVQPGISICYGDGTSSRIVQEATADPSTRKIYGNRRSKIYHCPGQAAYEEMKDSPNLVIFDSEAQAQLLAKKLQGMAAHVNLIPLNHVEGSPLVPSTRVAAFQKQLERRGLTATVRRRLGSDIDASCGQLRRKAIQTANEKGADPS